MTEHVAVREGLHGALWPIVRQAVQHFAGIALGTGVLAENEVVAITGFVMAVGNLGWMLVARIRAAR
jgi:hypothetical protein